MRMARASRVSLSDVSMTLSEENSYELSAMVDDSIRCTISNDFNMCALKIVEFEACILPYRPAKELLNRSRAVQTTGVVIRL
jgi:hypothetical protein